MSELYRERPIVQAGSCTWCAHAPHPASCSDRIQVDVINKKPVTEPCPCVRRNP